MQDLQPAEWLKLEDYSYGIVANGSTIFLAGQTGVYPHNQQLAAPDMAGQAEQALKNIATLLETAGAKPSQITRLNWYVVDRQQYYQALPAIRRAYQVIMDSTHLPAMTLLVVAGLAREGLLIEIEATAVLAD
jgi:enamine deaminase RidA (YjgF/YER057c/UK114 family)